MNQSEISKAVGAVIGLGVLAFWAYWQFGGGFEKEVQVQQQQIRVEAAKEMGRIEKQVASDSEKQYKIAKKNGTPIDACVHAGMVAAAHLQAKNEPAYKKWKGIEKTDCEIAGVPR